MNPRFLSKPELFMEEIPNSNVFWGFLDDLWYLFHNKKSAYDSRQDLNEHTNYSS